MNKNIAKNRTLLERFSSCLIGRGKKDSGHKILLESLFFLRQKNDKTLLNLILLKDKAKNEELKNRSESYRFKNSSNSWWRSHLPLQAKISNKLLNDKAKIVTPVRAQPLLLDAYSEKLAFGTEGSEQTPVSSLLNKSICKICVDNVKPILETRKVRKGRITYRVPLVTQTGRQEGKAISFLIKNASSRKILGASSFQKRIQTTIPPVDTDLQSITNRIFLSKLISNVSESKITQKDLLSIESFHNELKKKFLRFSSSPSPSPKATATATAKEKEALFIASLRKLKINSIRYTLSEEFFDSFFEKGVTVDKKKELHTLALQNRAYTHYRWW